MWAPRSDRTSASPNGNRSTLVDRTGTIQPDHDYAGRVITDVQPGAVNWTCGTSSDGAIRYSYDPAGNSISYSPTGNKTGTVFPATGGWT